MQFSCSSSPDATRTPRTPTAVCQRPTCSQPHQSPFCHKADALTARPYAALMLSCLTNLPLLIIVTALTKCQQTWEWWWRDGDNNYDGDPQVVVRVLGANLYSPVFSQRFYLAEVQENAPPGSKVIQVSLPFHYSLWDFFLPTVVDADPWGKLFVRSHWVPCFLSAVHHDFVSRFVSVVISAF